MTKPTSVAKEDFCRELNNLINNSGLPAFVIELVLKDVLYQVSNISSSVYQKEKAEYDAELLKEAEGDAVET